MGCTRAAAARRDRWAVRAGPRRGAGPPPSAVRAPRNRGVVRRSRSARLGRARPRPHALARQNRRSDNGRRSRRTASFHRRAPTRSRGARTASTSRQERAPRRHRNHFGQSPVTRRGEASGLLRGRAPGIRFERSRGRLSSHWHHSRRRIRQRHWPSLSYLAVLAATIASCDMLPKPPRIEVPRTSLALVCSFLGISAFSP